MGCFMKRITLISIISMLALTTVLSLSFVAFAEEETRSLTDSENASFVTREEFIIWKNDFISKLEKLDAEATDRIFDNMDFYDLQYVFTDNYKNPYDKEEESSQYESYEAWRQEEIEKRKQSLENK